MVSIEYVRLSTILLKYGSFLVNTTVQSPLLTEKWGSTSMTNARGLRTSLGHPHALGSKVQRPKPMGIIAKREDHPSIKMTVILANLLFLSNNEKFNHQFIKYHDPTKN